MNAYRSGADRYLSISELPRSTWRIRLSASAGGRKSGSLTVAIVANSNDGFHLRSPVSPKRLARRLRCSRICAAVMHAIFTIGTQGRHGDGFIALLKQHAIDAVTEPTPRVAA